MESVVRYYLCVYLIAKNAYLLPLAHTAPKSVLTFNIVIHFLNRVSLITDVHCWNNFLLLGPRVRDKKLPPQYADHKCVSVEGRKQNRCALCQHQNVKTKSGWDVITRLQCKQCDINLCRECFVIYHILLSEGRAPALKRKHVMFLQYPKWICLRFSSVHRSIIVNYRQDQRQKR